ncbi:MAG TPA: FecR family protein [Niastella sp.]
MQNQEHFWALLDKYTSGHITTEEYDELFALINTGQYDHLLEQHFQANFYHEKLPGQDMPSGRAKELLHKILNAEKHTAHLLPRIFSKKKTARWYLVAIVTGLLAITTWLLLVNERHDLPEAVAERHRNNMLKKTNNSDQPWQIKMEDGSILTLQPNSTIHFPTHFLSDKREVHLEGEAFFEVNKNPDRPFFVYYKNLVTHVLGTSFNIKTDSRKRQVEVSVVTGKVQVYENRDSLMDKVAKTNGVILTPNQKVIYKEEERQFTATVVNDPHPLVPDTQKTTSLSPIFNFDETSILQVFRLLEKTYGIEIVVENDRLYNSLFTGNLTQHGLFTKLDIICGSVSASYQVVGTRILVKGKGCN